MDEHLCQSIHWIVHHNSCTAHEQVVEVSTLWLLAEVWVSAEVSKAEAPYPQLRLSSMTNLLDSHACVYDFDRAIAPKSYHR